MSARGSAAATEFWVRQRRVLDGRFWERVDKTGGPHACWPWLGGRQTKRAGGAGGYGTYTRHRRTLYAHRRALELTLGRPLGPGMQALHTCDNPPCCNPAHLFEGANADNIRDRNAKRRDVRLRSWPCPDCGSTVERLARAVGARCADCREVVRKAKRERDYAAWRAVHPLKRPECDVIRRRLA